MITQDSGLRPRCRGVTAPTAPEPGRGQTGIRIFSRCFGCRASFRCG